MPRTRNDQTHTTSRQLASVIKTARDIMRKDKGLSSDLDRLPMLTWIMFLKFLDDMEQNREVDATLQDKPLSPHRRLAVPLARLGRRPRRRHR